MQLNQSATIADSVIAKSNFQMKRNYFLVGIMCFSSLVFGQKSILVNGGLFGNPNENVNIMVYDPVALSNTVIDTIHTSSVQEILIDGDQAYVAAQDSIVLYDLAFEQRLAAAEFPGLSTKSLALSGNELLVGNFYGQGSNNLYIFDKTNLNVLDTVNLNKAVKSIFVHNGIAYIPQNNQTANFTDTLGIIVLLDVANRQLIDTLSIPNYTEDFGVLIPGAQGNQILSLNPSSNSISTITVSANNTISNTSLTYDLSIGGNSHWETWRDTLYVRTNQGIGVLQYSSLTEITPNRVDTVVTAFSLDTNWRAFYVSQTDFFSYQSGKMYNLSGSFMRSFPVGYSPEVLRFYYGNSLGLSDIEDQNALWTVYPNPANEAVFIQTDESTNAVDVEIYDTFGRFIRRDIKLQIGARINLEGLASGAYFVRLLTDRQIEQHKIIKR